MKIKLKTKLKLTLRVFILLTVSVRLLLACGGEENDELNGSGVVRAVGVLEEG